MVDITQSESSPNDCLDKLRSFVKTQKGFILAAEMVLSFVILICFLSSWFGGYFTIPTIALVYGTVIFIVFMMELDKRILAINWLWTDLFRAASGGVVYIIMFLICVTRGYSDNAFIAAGVFGIFAGILYAYDTYTICMQVQTQKRQPAAHGNIIC